MFRPYFCTSGGRGDEALVKMADVWTGALTFVLEVQDDGSVDWGDGEVRESTVLQLHVQCDGAQMRLPAQRPHGLKHGRQTRTDDDSHRAETLCETC